MKLRVLQALWSQVQTVYKRARIADAKLGEAGGQVKHAKMDLVQAARVRDEMSETVCTVRKELECVHANPN